MVKKKERKPMGYWNIKENVLKEALSYSSRSKFTELSNGAYESALRNGWLEEATEHIIDTRKPNNYWSAERLKVEALKYNSRIEFRNSSPSAYVIALRTGIIDDICEHMFPLGSLEKRFIYRVSFPDEAVYIGLTCCPEDREEAHLLDESSAVYQHMQEISHKPIFEVITELLPKDEASKTEKRLIKEYRESGFLVLNRDNGGGLGSGNRKWTFEVVKELALMYNTKKEFRENNSGAYDAAVRNKWLPSVCNHLTSTKKPDNYWTLELSIIEAKKYLNRRAFKIGAGTAYRVCKGNKVLDEILPTIYKYKNPSSDQEG